MGSRIRVTYATLSADNEELHAAYEEGLKTATPGSARRSRPGRTASAPTVPPSTCTVPSTLSGSCTVHSATDRRRRRRRRRRQAASASGRPRPGRSASPYCAGPADLISERSNELAALMSMEVGKNRLEALGDVEESADLLPLLLPSRWRTTTASPSRWTLSPRENTRSVLAPVRRVGRDQPVQLPDGAGRRADRRLRWWPATPSLLKPTPAGHVHAAQAVRVPARRRSAGRACSTSCPAATRSARLVAATTASTGSPSPARTRSA